MNFLESVRLALDTIRVQKLKSFFTLLGVMIGVMFLIAVVSIVQGMSNYVENDFIGRLLGANTFTVRRYPWFGNNTGEQEWLEWQRRPRFFPADVAFIRTRLPPDARSAIESENTAFASSIYVRPKQVEAHAVDGDYFTIKNYTLSAGRTFTAQESAAGTAVVVVGEEAAKYFFPNLSPLERELRVGGLPYRVIGVIEHQGSLFGMSLDRMVIAPYASPMRRFTNPRGDTDGFIVQAGSPATLSDAMEEVREGLRARRKLRPAQPDNPQISEISILASDG